MKRILIASDGSTFAEDAARLLAHFPHDEKLEITVVTILPDEVSYERFAPDDWLAQFAKEKQEEAEQTFENIESMFEGSNAKVVSVIGKGHAGSTIVRLSNQLASDLIVIGAKGHSQISRIVLGSTSDYVATHAKCSVLVVRPTGLEDAERSLKIVLGYEDTDVARRALGELADFPWRRNVHIDVVSALTRMFGLTGVSIPDDRAVREAQDAARTAAGELTRITSDIQSHVVEHEQIGEALVSFVEEQGTDLIFVGETDRSLIGRVLIGSVSRYVLRHAPCSVWIVRERKVRALPERDQGEESHYSVV